MPEAPSTSVTVYTKPGCGGCMFTIRSIEDMGFTPRVIDVSTDPGALEIVRAMGYQQVPVVVTDYDHWSGARPDKLQILKSHAPATAEAAAVAG